MKNIFTKEVKETLNQIHLNRLYKKGDKDLIRHGLNSFMFMGDQSEIDCEFSVISDNLIDSDNPKYQKYLTDEFDRDDHSMIFEILVNETKYSESFMKNITKLIEFKNEVIKYYDQQNLLQEKYGVDSDCNVYEFEMSLSEIKTRLIEKVFQFYDWDEFEDYELDESEFEKDELWGVSV